VSDVLGSTRDKIVQADDLMAIAQQSIAQVRTQETRRTRDQYPHIYLIHNARIATESGCPSRSLTAPKSIISSPLQKPGRP
jgi:hypothetical protein